MALVRPKKNFSQNFLLDKNIINKILTEFNPRKTDYILEIGPGTGALTENLFRKTKNFVAIEIDKNAVEELKTKIPDLNVLNDDFLKLNIDSIFGKNKTLRIIGNIPYHITTPIIFKIFDYTDIVSDALIMMQEEVADRIIAKPGNKIYGILSVLSQYFSTPKKIFTVSKNVFYPKPKVNSAVVKFIINQNRQLNANEEILFRKIVRTAFNQRRKTLRNSLEKVIPTEIQNNISFEFSRRAEELSLEEYIFLTKEAIKFSVNLNEN